MSERQTVFRIVLAACLLALAALPARADSCASVVAGARMGPAPESTDWRWTNACYVSWPGGTINGLDARLSYGALCQRVEGYLDFQGDARAKRNICIFSSPDGSTSTAAAARPAQQAAAKPESKRELLFEDNDPSGEPLGATLFSRGKTNLPAALERLKSAKEQRLRGLYAYTYVAWSTAADNLAADDPDKTVRELSAYAKCMSELDQHLSRHMRSGITWRRDVELTMKRCRGVTGEFVSQTTSEVQRLQDAVDEANKAPPLTSAVAAPGPTIPSRCLVIHETRETDVACSTLKTWKKTLISSPKGAAGCPGEIPISYVDDRGEETKDVPAVLQTCGSGPLGVRITK